MYTCIKHRRVSSECRSFSWTFSDSFFLSALFYCSRGRLLAWIISEKKAKDEDASSMWRDLKPSMYIPHKRVKIQRMKCATPSDSIDIREFLVHRRRQAKIESTRSKLTQEQRAALCCGRDETTTTKPSERRRTPHFVYTLVSRSLPSYYFFVCFLLFRLWLRPWKFFNKDSEIKNARTTPRGTVERWSCADIVISVPSVFKCGVVWCVDRAGLEVL